MLKEARRASFESAGNSPSTGHHGIYLTLTIRELEELMEGHACLIKDFNSFRGAPPEDARVEAASSRRFLQNRSTSMHLLLWPSVSNPLSEGPAEKNWVSCAHHATC